MLQACIVCILQILHIFVCLVPSCTMYHTCSPSLEVDRLFVEACSTRWQKPVCSAIHQSATLFLCGCACRNLLFSPFPYICASWHILSHLLRYCSSAKRYCCTAVVLAEADLLQYSEHDSAAVICTAFCIIYFVFSSTSIS